MLEPNATSNKISLASGWLLAYAISGLLVSVGIAYEVYKQFSAPLLLISIGFALVGVLLLIRSEWVVPVNMIFSMLLIAFGVYVWYRVGRPGYLVGAVLCLVSTFIFRDELRKNSNQR